MSRRLKTEKEDKAQKLKEAFAILTQGVEMIHHDRSGGSKASTRKIVWMDSDILRLCIDTRRPTLADRAQGKIPPGIYMRDISIVLMGEHAARSYDFGFSGSIPENPENYLALIATERSICLELPSEYACRWFHERLELVAMDILTEDEREERRSNQVNRSHLRAHAALTHQQIEFARQFGGLLKNGFKVSHHHPVGRIYTSFLYTDVDLKVLTVECEDRTFFGYHVAKVITIGLLDVAEIRTGTHSFGFVGTMSTDKHKESCSIISSQCSIDIQFANESTRNLFVERFKLLLHYLQQQEGRGEGWTSDHA